MKDKYLQLKVAQSFKDRIKKAADFLGIGISAFVIQAINEKLEKIGIVNDKD